MIRITTIFDELKHLSIDIGWIQQRLPVRVWPSVLRTGSTCRLQLTVSCCSLEIVTATAIHQAQFHISGLFQFSAERTPRSIKKDMLVMTMKDKTFGRTEKTRKDREIWAMQNTVVWRSHLLFFWGGGWGRDSTQCVSAVKLIFALSAWSVEGMRWRKSVQLVQLLKRKWQVSALICHPKKKVLTTSPKRQRSAVTHRTERMLLKALYIITALVKMVSGPHRREHIYLLQSFFCRKQN